MQILKSGTITGVTGAIFSSGVSTAIIDINGRNRGDGKLQVLAKISGDLGRTGGSVALFWKTGVSRAGEYMAPENPYILKSGTSKGGFFSNGSYVTTITCYSDIMRLQAVASKAGSTQHGSATTNSCIVDWSILGL